MTLGTSTFLGAVVTIAVFASTNRRQAANTGTRGTVIIEEREIR